MSVSSKRRRVSNKVSRSGLKPAVADLEAVSCLSVLRVRSVSGFDLLSNERRVCSSRSN